MRNYKITIAYDGTKYQGWQKQKNTDNTIQGILEQAISDFIGYQVTIDGSGRTDGGVHAYGQVANVKISGKVAEETFREELNERLPDDIRIRKVELVKNGFHSRYSAKAKRYEYIVDRNEKPNVFTRKYCYHFTKSLDIERMKEAAELLKGTHDFGGFTDKKDEKSTVRTIYQIQIEKEKGKIRLEFYGNGFMYHMVRILTGTLLEIGTGEKTLEDIGKIFQTRERKEAGTLVPSIGLCLREVLYD